MTTNAQSPTISTSPVPVQHRILAWFRQSIRTGIALHRRHQETAREFAAYPAMRSSAAAILPVDPR